MQPSPLAKAAVAAILLGSSAAVHAGASCLLFPLSCLKTQKKYGEEVDAQIIAIDTDHTKTVTLSVPSVYSEVGSVGTSSSPLDSTREFFVSFQVGMTRYVAWEKDTLVQMAGMLGGYNPKREEWVGKTFKMRFVDENWLGLEAPTAVFKTPQGKEWKLVVIDIIGPDGVDEREPYFGLQMNLGHCKPQAEIDRPKREQQILASLKEQGVDKPLWELQDATLAKAVHRQRAGTAMRNGNVMGGYLGPQVTHDRSGPAADVPHPDVATAGAADAATPTATEPVDPAAAQSTPAAGNADPSGGAAGAEPSGTAAGAAPAGAAAGAVPSGVAASAAEPSAAATGAAPAAFAPAAAAPTPPAPATDTTPSP